MKKNKINVIKSGVGNIGSIIRVLNDLDTDHIIIDKPGDFSDTKKIILPGIGSFDSFMKSLKSKNLFYKIRELVMEKKYSILGICVGMQALFQGSEEGITSGFGFINHKCKKFESDTKKVPHIGWNQINIHKNSKLFEQIETKLFYFAHSYAFLDQDEDITLTTTKYIVDFSSSISFENIYGVQFHPEKSFFQGQKILKNFIDLC
jgi:glutamine amidotransferase